MNAPKFSYVLGYIATVNEDGSIPLNSRTVEVTDFVKLYDALRAENARLREALEGLLANAPHPKGIKQDYSYILYREAARAALEKDKP